MTTFGDQVFQFGGVPVGMQFPTAGKTFFLDPAFVIPAGLDPSDKRILLLGCRSIGATKWDANDRGMVYGDMDVVTPVDLSGSLKQLVE